jgi:cell division protein FtsI (penicillin-binding protein 3)
MRNLDPNRAKWIRFRMGALLVLVASGFGALASTAWRVQVEEGHAWRAAAEAQSKRKLHVAPKRGTISDRHGTPFAVSIEVPSLSVDVAELLHGVEGQEAQAQALMDAARTLAKPLALDEHDLYQKLSKKKRFQWIKRRLSAEEVTAVQALVDPRKTDPNAKPLKGLSIDGEGQRYYPARTLLGPVLGRVAPDGTGQEGLELALDEELQGHAVEASKGGDDGAHAEDAATGHGIELAIDEGIQHVAEREIEAALKTYETRGASIVVLDPETGEILALASAPGFNPNDFVPTKDDTRLNHAVVDRFEPGSVMKVFTFAAALSKGVLAENEKIYCEHGYYELAGAKIHDTHENDLLTPTQILAKSSNIGTLKIALRLGEPELYGAFRRFGFGEPTGLPVPGESGGILRPRGRPWVEVETATASFGQGIGVTTMQLAMAMGAIANGGKLMEPILVRRVTDARGQTLRENVPHVRREVVPRGVAKTVAEMLTAVVEDGGTGVEAAIPGYRVAGKTATAQKADPATGRYSEDKYIASFVGFVPADKPKVVVAVVLDEPMIGRYGGDLAGPVFRRVAESSLRYLGVTPFKGSAKLADISRKDDVADRALDALRPTPPSTLAPPTDTSFGPPAPGASEVPDLTSLPAREALLRLTKLGLLPEMEGTGRLVRQQPAAGTRVPKGSKVHLVFEPGS